GLAPTGKMRVGLNMSNFLLTRTDAATGAPAGVAPDLAQELGRRLGVPVELIPYPNPGALADAAKSNVWDVGFLGAEPQRAEEIDFTAAYVEIEATYLVQPGSSLKTVADVDQEGVRIAISEKSAYDLYLSRNLNMLSPRAVYLDEIMEGDKFAPRPATLDGKVVGLLPNWRPSAIHILQSVGALLQERYKLKGLVMEQPVRELPLRAGKLIDTMKDQLQSLVGRVDVVITATGD